MAFLMKSQPAEMVQCSAELDGHYNTRYAHAGHFPMEGWPKDVRCINGA